MKSIQCALISIFIVFGMKTRADSDLAIPYKVATGVDSTCALTSKGVICWGGAQNERSNIFNYPNDLVSPMEIVAYGNTYCVIDQSKIKCWGDTRWINTLQIPNNLSSPRNLTIQEGHLCLVVNEGVRCWGESARIVNQIPADLKNPKQIIVGPWEYACASTDEGVRCWGKRCHGPFCGDLDSIEALGSVKKLTSNGLTACAILTNGKLKCVVSIVDDPRKPPSDVKFAEDIVLSSQTACALDSERIRCWGNTKYNGMNYNILLKEIENHPIQNAYSLAISEDMQPHMCVLARQGLKCWGSKSFLQTNPPKRIKDPIQIKVSSDTACVQGKDDIFCWGFNTYTNTKNFNPYKTDILFSVSASELQDFTFHNSFNPGCILYRDEKKCEGKTVAEKVNKSYGIWNDEQYPASHTCYADINGLHCDGTFASEPNLATNTPVIREKIRKVIFDRGNSSACAFTDKDANCWGSNFSIKQNLKSFSDATYVYSQVSNNPSEQMICILVGDGEIKCGRPWDKTWSREKILSVPTKIPGASFISSSGLNRICFGFSDRIDCWDTEKGIKIGSIATPNLKQIAMGSDSGRGMPEDQVVCAIFSGTYDCWQVDGKKPENSKVNLSPLLTNLSKFEVQQF